MSQVLQSLSRCLSFVSLSPFRTAFAPCFSGTLDPLARFAHCFPNTVILFGVAFSVIVKMLRASQTLLSLAGKLLSAFKHSRPFRTVCSQCRKNSHLFERYAPCFSNTAAPFERLLFVKESSSSGLLSFLQHSSPVRAVCPFFCQIL